MFIRANEQVLCCDVGGTAAGHPLMFINSLGSSLQIWDGVIDRLPDRYRFVRHDKRGHGLSDCPAPPYKMRDHAADVAGLMDALDIDKAVLIGISVGGMIAQDFAAAWPERVAGLVLCDTAAKIGTAEMWNTRIDTLRAHGMDHLGDAIVARWFAPAFAETDPASYAGHRHMLTRTPLMGYTGVCEAIRDADLTAATRTINAPALALCGAEDLSTTPDMVRGLAELMPNARYQEIAGAGHLPCVEQPEGTAAAIQQFLEEIGYV